MSVFKNTCETYQVSAKSLTLWDVLGLYTLLQAAKTQDRELKMTNSSAG